MINDIKKNKPLKEEKMSISAIGSVTTVPVNVINPYEKTNPVQNVGNTEEADKVAADQSVKPQPAYVVELSKNPKEIQQEEELIVSYDRTGKVVKSGQGERV